MQRLATATGTRLWPARQAERWGGGRGSPTAAHPVRRSDDPEPAAQTSSRRRRPPLEDKRVRLRIAGVERTDCCSHAVLQLLSSQRPQAVASVAHHRRIQRGTKPQSVKRKPECGGAGAGHARAYRLASSHRRLPSTRSHLDDAHGQSAEWSAMNPPDPQGRKPNDRRESAERQANEHTTNLSFDVAPQRNAQASREPAAEMVGTFCRNQVLHHKSRVVGVSAHCMRKATGCKSGATRSGDRGRRSPPSLALHHRSLESLVQAQLGHQSRQEGWPEPVGAP